VERLKPGATALGLADQPLGGISRMPVFSCEPFGKGRTFAMSTDTTRDWGLLFEFHWGENDNRYFRKFWRNVVYWLSENSAGGNRRLRVDTDKVVYHPGEQIKVSAHAYDDRLEETNRYRLMARLRPKENMSALEPAALTLKAADSTYQGTVGVPPLRSLPAPASHEASPLRTAVLDVLAYDQDQQVAQSSLDVQIVDDPVEFQDPRPDQETLENLAKATDGKSLHSAEDLAQLMRSFSTVPGEVVVTRSPLWDHPVLWLALVLLLTLDWVVRRWWGLA
jgi:hypothetical protein